MHDDDPDYKLNFGFTVGVNSSHFRINHSQAFVESDSILVVESGKGQGFNVGIISEFAFNNHWSLRFIPALSFAEKDLDYTICTGIDANGVCKKELVKKPIESIYTTFPLLMKFSSEKFNNKANKVYVVGGFRYTYDWASNSEARQDDNVVKITKNDFTIDYGAGLDIYLPMAKIAFEIKASYGLVDILVREPNLIYSNMLDRLNSRSLLFSMHIGG